MVQTVKQCMRKCAAAGHDPNLAMLIYRATPLTTSIHFTITCITIEWTKVQSITSNQIPYPESPLPGCPRANGERQEQNARALQQNCKGSTFTATESENVRTSSPPVDSSNRYQNASSMSTDIVQCRNY